MRFLADEGCDPQIIEAVRALGFDVAVIAELAPATSDEAILAWGLREKRLILHHDLDFGTLIFRDKLPTYGVILVRIPDVQRESRAQRIRDLLKKNGEDNLVGVVTRVSLTRITRTPINAEKSQNMIKIVAKTPKFTAEQQNSPINSNILQPPHYDEWKSFALSFDGEALCRQMGIRPTAWYAQQMKAYRQTGVWNLSLMELRLMLYLEANKVKYNGGVENKARVESLLAEMRKCMGE